MRNPYCNYATQFKKSNLFSTLTTCNSISNTNSLLAVTNRLLGI